MCVALRLDAATGEAAIEIFDDRMLDFARAHGPLFAREPLARGVDGAPLGPDVRLEEPRTLWSSAAIMANLAVVAQECANLTLPLAGAQAALGNLVHLRIGGSDASEPFDLYVVSRPIAPAYADWLDIPCFVRREQEAAAGRLHYGFLLPEPDGGVDLVVASFRHEIATPDWRLLLGALELEGRGRGSRARPAHRRRTRHRRRRAQRRVRRGASR